MGLLQLIFQLTIIFMVVYLVIRAIYLGTHNAAAHFFTMRFEMFTAFVLSQREDDDGYMFFYLFPIAFWWYAVPYFIYHRYALKDTTSSLFDLYGLVAYTEEEKMKLATRQLEPLQDAPGDTTEVQTPSIKKEI